MKLRSIHLTIQGTDWGVRALRDQQIPSEGPRNMSLNLNQCTCEGEENGKLPQGRRGRSACGGDGIILERVLAVGGRPLPGHKLSGIGISIE